MPLESTLREFAAVFQRSPKSSGNFKIALAPHATRVNLPLNSDLETYFKLIDFDDKPQIGGFLSMFLFSPNELEDALSGWRWIRSKSGQTVESPNWNPAWIIIGERNGDVIFVDTSDTKVLGSIQGENFLVAENLTCFFEALTDAIKVEMEKYRFDVRTEDMEPLPEFEQDVKNLISRKLGDDALPGFMEFFFG
jgi:hypothetical protein